MIKQLFALFTELGAGWVMYILIGLSVVSVALMLERLIYFIRFSSPESSKFIEQLSQGKLNEVKAQLLNKKGLEATAIVAAIDTASGGPEAVESIIASVVADQKPIYERFLSFLGTLGNNAPFLGLFGTVIGIIKAFADLSLGGVGGAKATGATVVMAGISEALVATAVGIFVAIPAVVAFNGYNRWLKVIVGRTQALGHALCAYLKKTDQHNKQVRLSRVDAA